MVDVPASMKQDVPAVQRVCLRRRWGIGSGNHKNHKRGHHAGRKSSSIYFVKCQRCERLIVVGSSRKRQKFCSYRCSTAAIRNINLVRLTPRACVICGHLYQPRVKKQKCCGLVCARQSAKQVGALMSLGADGKRARNSRKNRLRRQRGWRVEVRRWLRIGDRDGWVCHLCGCGVLLTAGGPSAPTVDHVIPLARGGSDDDSNVRLAHKSCNSRKRDRMPTWVG